MAEVKNSMRRKMTLVLVLTLLGFVAVVIKLFVIQFIQGDFLQQQAEERRTRDLVVSASRGTVFDRNGNKLAISITSDSLAALPASVAEGAAAAAEAGTANYTADTARYLSELLGLDYDKVYGKLTANTTFEWIKRKVDFDLAAEIDAKIEAGELPGIQLVEESQRYYPQGTLAAHVLGFAGIDNQGLEGVEIALDQWLQGEDGRIIGQYDAKEHAIPYLNDTYIPPVDGCEVYLTLDENIQYFCERELEALMNSETPPKRAGIIVMNPKNGDILALACSEPFDPNHWEDYESSSWRNFLISDSYEPGSTFKIVTAATALEEGTVDLNSSFYDPGYINVAGAQIHCWASVPHGSQDLAAAVKNSCNPAFVQIGQSIEAKEKGLFYKYIKAFNFGSQTGVDLPGEATGILQAPENVNAVEIATISIGQGIAVTPIQMVTAASAVANGGQLLRPQIVEKVVRDGKTVYEGEADIERRIISADTAATLRELLVGVVRDGSGKNAAVSGYHIAGKTGTAQKAEGGVYVPGRYVASFVGMAPADDPELVCLVIVDEPSGVFYGSQVAAPIFKAVVSDALRYLGVAPSYTSPDSTGEDAGIVVQVPNVVNLDLDSAVNALHASGFSVEVVGDGLLVSSQYPAGLSMADSGSTVALHTGGVAQTESGVQVTVPDLRGKRFAEIASLMSQLGLGLMADGNGVAYAQEPAAGTLVDGGSVVTVKFNEENQTINTMEP